MRQVAPMLSEKRDDIFWGEEVDYVMKNKTPNISCLYREPLL